VQKVTIPLPDDMYGDNIGKQGHPGSNLPFFVRHFLLRYLQKKKQNALSDRLHDVFWYQSIQTIAMVPFDIISHSSLAQPQTPKPAPSLQKRHDGSP
jgi:hypothetical protein